MHEKLINSVLNKKTIEADEQFQRAITEKALVRLDQFKKDTAQAMFKKKDQK